MTALEETAVLDIVSPNTGDVHVFTAMGDCDGFRSADLSVSPPTLGQSQSPSLQEGTSDDIDAAWNDANYVVRLTRVSPYVQYSNDNGVTWHWASSTGVTSNSNGGGCVSISADGLYMVYQGSSGTQVVYATRSGSGSSATWSSWQTPSSNRPAANAKLVADLVAGHTFYAISGNAVYRSTDGGATWTTMTTSSAPSNINWVRAVFGYTGNLLAACQGSGLYRSTDGGATWTRINSSAVTTANGVGVGMAAPGQSYPAIYVCGTVNGVNGFFRSDDQGATWITISDLAHQYNYCGLIQGDPRIYGRVYLSGYGRGLVYGDIHTSPTSLPSGWSTQDIGSVGSTGAAGSSSTDTWELTGGGSGITSNTDSFRFAYTTLTGDGSITAQVMDVPSDNPSNHNALAGVMIRNNLTAISAEVLMAMSPGSVNGAVFKYRSSQRRHHQQRQCRRRVESLLGAAHSQRQYLHRLLLRRRHQLDAGRLFPDHYHGLHGLYRSGHYRLGQQPGEHLHLPERQCRRSNDDFAGRAHEPGRDGSSPPITSTSPGPTTPMMKATSP